MIPLRTWPQDALQHEVRSLRYFLRQFDECPLEVRITHPHTREIVRPLIIITPTSLSRRMLGPRLVELWRSATINWYGEDDEKEAWAMASWLTWAISQGEGGLGTGAIRIYDWSGDTHIPTRSAIDPEDESINATPQRDAVGKWMVPLDFRWIVRLGNLPDDGLYPPSAIPEPPVVDTIGRSYVYDTTHLP